MHGRIREAVEEDLEAIVAIYNASVPGREATADTDPVSVESRRDWFANHDPRRYPIRVLTTASGEIIGWVSTRPFYGRPAYRATAEISVYVASAHHGKGCARQLLNSILESAPELGISTLLAFVFGHNDRSLKLFESAGFQRWGCLPRIAELDSVRRDLVLLGRPVDGPA